jgi:hypothetical protein
MSIGETELIKAIMPIKIEKEQMDNDVVETEKLKELDAEFSNKYPGRVIVDGIVDWDGASYYDSDTRILWIMKEANQSDPNKKEWCLRDVLWEVSVGKDKGTWWKNTYGLIAKVSCRLLPDYKENYNDISTEDEKEILKELAIINVKKISGGSSANSAEVEQFYRNDKDLILSQINALKPGIIINCSRVWDLFNDLKTSEYEDIGPYDAFDGPFQVAYSGERLLINAYHTNVRGATKKSRLF